MYVPSIVGYRGLNIPSAENDNSSYSQGHPDQQHEPTTKKQQNDQRLWTRGEKELPVLKLDNSQGSFPLTPPSLLDAFHKQKVDFGGFPNRSPNMSVPQNNEETIVSSASQASRRGLPIGNQSTKRLRSTETELVLSNTSKGLKKARTSILGKQITGLPGSSRLPSSFDGEGSKNSEKPGGGKRSISTIAEQGMAIKRQKLTVLENGSHHSGRDIFAFIPKYRGLDVPNISPQRKE